MRHDPHFYGVRRIRAGDRDRSPAQSSHDPEDRRERWLPRGASHRGRRAEAHRLPKPEAGHFAKAQVEPGQGLWEFRLAADEGADLKPGAEIKVDVFQKGQLVDVAGVTKGKGYAGVIKRHNFSHQYFTHGNSLSHRAPGAIGQRQTPGRVFPGKRMAGHLGNERASTINLEILQRRPRAQRAADQRRGSGCGERPRDA